MAPISEWVGKIRRKASDATVEVSGPDRPWLEASATVPTPSAVPSVPAQERAPAAPAAGSGVPVDVEALREKVIATLREIYDPEIPVNIYDLGLIYEVRISADGDVDIDMTLTTPGCPVAATFPGTVESMVANVEEVREARVELVWDPPWTMDRMPYEVKLELGLV